MMAADGSVMPQYALDQELLNLQSMLTGPTACAADLGCRIEVSKSISQIKEIQSAPETIQTFFNTVPNVMLAITLPIAGDAALEAMGLGSAAKVGVSTTVALDQATIDGILSTPKGLRPDPTTYLSPSYISDSLAKFDSGATRLMTENNLSKYGIGQRDGTSFVMPSQEANSLLSSVAGDARILEDRLGLPNNFLDSNKLVRVDIPNPSELNLRLPSGNEAGASSLWTPGGKLPNAGASAQ